MGVQDAWVGLREMQGSLQSRLLTCMLSDGASVDMQEPLNELLGYTDWEQAAERGRIVPHAGSDANFDAAEHQVQGFSHPQSTAGDDNCHNNLQARWRNRRSRQNVRVAAVMMQNNGVAQG